MRCRYCKGELIHHYASAYKCDSERHSGILGRGVPGVAERK